MKSNGGGDHNKNIQTSGTLRRIKRMRLRSKNQQGQNDVASKKMAGNNSTLSLHIIKTKSLFKHKKLIKQSTQSRESLFQDPLQKDQKNVKLAQEPNVKQQSTKNKQTISQRKLRRNEKLKELIDAQIKAQINQKIKFHDTKFKALTEIGIPTINLNQDKIIQFIEQFQNEIKQNDESIIQKLVGAIGEGYAERGDEVISNVDAKEMMIQKQVEFYLENCGIKLEWTLERWRKLIRRTLFVVPFCHMPNVKIKEYLNGRERYQIMFETLNLFTLINRWSNTQMFHQFSQNFPFQVKDDIEIKELVNENELHNIRQIREYLSRIMTALNDIYQLKFQKEFQVDLYQTNNQLQDLQVEYYLRKMKVLQLKPVNLPQAMKEQIEQLSSKVQIQKDPIIDEPSKKQMDQEKQIKPQNQVQQKKKIQINLIKSKTLLEYFKPVKNQNSINADVNSQGLSQNKDKNGKQTPESKSQFSYFEILDELFSNKFGKTIQKEGQKK
ncbi:unnamed protein product (macronuclear) [Paramecium tetraurelia]|uniref:Uncharacterized protein n=1 Tax=Paramecium tetraurelia TaxID=5888 RepID=A0E5F4_PARTE|nr:uncharacterized protein GSPATT00003382001 [Paramecium tetraurelia]CAK90521.1 unnamed protein product [Paramecium tetraurelia]|eukprot:XP_001457918.1 hypothetical protein (macronuclear) [Paramecium tetraurelia strain d4-2]